jgi:integrase
VVAGAGGGGAHDRVGPAVYGRARVRALPVWHRFTDRGPAGRSDPDSPSLAAAVHLLRCRRHRADGAGGAVDPAAVARGDLPDADRVAGRNPGLRIGEAIRLDRGDIDFDQGVLLVRRSKFGKSRVVPLQSSTRDALDAYAARRDRLCPRPASESFFVSLRGTRIIYACVWPTHRALCQSAGVGAGATHPPRVHDHRHSFAVRTLVGWYRDGHDIHGRLPWLSTYLGHREPRYTYHYLSAAPELLAHAARLLERDQAVER